MLSHEMVQKDGVKIYRFNMPFQSLKDKIQNHLIRTVVSKLSGYLTILKLAFLGNKILKENEIDIIYGYESHGVLAVNILRKLGKVNNQKIVSRFQGTFYIIIIKSKQHLKRVLNWDSTCSYADKEGFRCGVCYEYSVFNILTRKKLNLKEKPLIVMEGSFATYQPNIKPEKMLEKIRQLIDKVKKYNGEFVFLWHNSSFNTNEWERYQKIYDKVTK